MADLSQLSDEEIDEAIARRQQPQRPGRARYLSDDDLEREIARQEDVRRRRPRIEREVLRRSLDRRYLDTIMPGLSLTDVAVDPRRRRAAVEGVRDFGRDVGGFFSQTPAQAWAQVQRGASRGLARAPGTLVEMASHPVETLYGMTVEPLARHEDSVRAQDRAELMGDEGAADEAARAANTAALDTAINAGGAGVGGRMTGLFGHAARGRGFGAYAAQTGQGAATGTAFGGGVGFLRTPGDLEERTAGGAEGAGVGAAIGVAAPAAVNVARAAPHIANAATFGVAPRIVSAASQAIDAMSQPDPNSVGAFARPPRRRPPPQREEPIPEEGRIAKMFERARMSGDALEAEATQARANPQGQTLVDLARTTGVRTIRPVVQSPGETSALAERIAGERFGNAPGLIARRAREGLDVKETPTQAVERLEGDYRRLSAEAYEPHWQEQPTARQVQLFDERIAPWLDPENPNVPLRNVMQDAVRRADEQFGLDRANGIVRGELADNLPRYLHYIKGALGELAEFEATPLRGTSGRRIASLRDLYHQFSDLLDPEGGEAIIPGYRETTSRAGDYFSARRALRDGERWIDATEAEVRADRARMSSFELRHARIALAESIRRSSRGQVTGQRNAANGLLNDPDAQTAIKAAFDTPEQAAQFIETVDVQNQLMRNASQWGGGASTFSNAAFGIDGAMAAVKAVKSPVETMLHGVADALWHEGVERSNNRFGEAALRRVDTAESRSFVRRLARILRQRAAERAAAAAATRTGAATGGAQPSRDSGRGR